MAKRGRPSTYDENIAAEICERIGSGEPLAQICRDEKMPALRTVYDWQEANEEFSARIARAREAGFDAIAVEALNIIDADPERVVTMTGDDRSESRIDSAAVQWAKNRAETRLKLLAKWDPKRYGDLVKVGNPDGSNLTPEMDETARAMRLAAVLTALRNDADHSG